MLDEQNQGNEGEISKQEQILNGAMQEFLTHGYAGTSMDRVAKTAGVSKATVYSHFGDKQGLFTALVERLAEKKFELLFDPKLLSASPTVGLRELATKGLLNAMADQEHLTFVRLIIGESGRFPELAQTFARSLAFPAIYRLTQYFIAHPELKIQDPEAAARIFMGSMVYFVLLQEILGGKTVKPTDFQGLVNTLVDLLTQYQEKTIN